MVGAGFVPVTLLVTAAVYALAACATFAGLPERAKPQPGRHSGAWQQLRHTFAQAQEYRDMRRGRAAAVAAG